SKGHNKPHPIARRPVRTGRRGCGSGRPENMGKVIESIPARRVELYARNLGVKPEMRTVGLIAREVMSRGEGKVVCACGDGPSDGESLSSGLYLELDGSIRRICGTCWLKANTRPT